MNRIPTNKISANHYAALSMAELRKLNDRVFYSSLSRFMHNTMLYVTRPLLKTSITPNHITVFWIMMQLAGSFLMIYGTYRSNVIGVLLYVGAALLDYVDGQIARIKKISTYQGLFLEDLGIYFGSPIFMLCFSIGVAHSTADYRYLLLGIISALAILYSKLAITNPVAYPPAFRENILKLHEHLSSRSRSNKLVYLFMIFRRSQPLNFLLLGILFNLPRLVLITYTLLYLFEFGRRMSAQLYTLHQLDRKRVAEPSPVAEQAAVKPE